jgi:hypothetical protein
MRYLRNIAVALSWCGFALSCLVNALRGGSGSETLCSALHRNIEDSGWSRHVRWPRAVRDHCHQSREMSRLSGRHQGNQ